MGEEPGIDRRIIRTKLAIRNAFVSLVEEKGFDALSIKDITNRADINRGTFYLHYRDKFDLLEQTKEALIQDIEGMILKANSLNLADFNSIDNPLPVMVTVFEYLKVNAPLIQAILGLKDNIAFQNQIRKTIEKNLKVGFLDSMRPENFLVPGEYLITYMLSAHLGVVQAWLQKGCLESPKEMAIILSKLSFKGPFRAAGIYMAN